mgnify:CR=1 FL=1
MPHKEAKTENPLILEAAKAIYAVRMDQWSGSPNIPEFDAPMMKYTREICLRDARAAFSVFEASRD